MSAREMEGAADALDAALGKLAEASVRLTKAGRADLVVRVDGVYGLAANIVRAIDGPRHGLLGADPDPTREVTDRSHRVDLSHDELDAVLIALDRYAEWRHGRTPHDHATRVRWEAARQLHHRLPKLGEPFDPKARYATGRTVLVMGDRHVTVMSTPVKVYEAVMAAGDGFVEFVVRDEGRVHFNVARIDSFGPEFTDG